MPFDFPSAPNTGDTVEGPYGEIYTFDGGRWTLTAGGGGGGGGGGASVSIGSSPPLNPLPGDLWWDDVGGQLYIYYNDGTSSQWVVTVNAVALGAVLEAPADGQSYLRNGLNEDWVPGLPLTGGTITGGFTVTGTTSLGNQVAIGGTENQILFGPDPSNATVLNMSGGNLTIAGVGTLISTLTLAANVYAMQGSFTGFPNGIAYTGLGGNHAIAFLWSGVAVGTYLDGSWVGDMQLSTSDPRLKTNVGSVDIDPLAVIDQLHMQQFDLTPPGRIEAKHWNVGFMSDQLIELIPEAVTPGDGEKTYDSIDLMPLMAYTFAAIQQLSARVVALEGAR